MRLTKQQINSLHLKLEEIGREMLTIYNSEFSHELKEDNSPLTKADMLSHEILIKYLKQEFPEIAIISEEDDNAQQIDDNTLIWLIDPLDGTKDFVNKTDEFSIMLALLDTKREPIAGFVYAPALNTLWFAQKGEGTYKVQNNKEELITSSVVNDIKQSRLIRSRSHFSSKDEEISSKLGISAFIQSGSAGIKFCKIAQGDGELCYYSTDKMGIWDIAPAHIILKEAGGNMKTMLGNNLKYDLNSKKMRGGVIGVNSGLNIDTIVKSLNE